MISLPRMHRIPILLLCITGILYWSFSWELERSDFIKLMSIYTALSLLTWKIFQLEKSNFLFLLFSAALFRGIFLFSLPNLSPDFYRFLWDGNLLLQGLNPYMTNPAALEGFLPAPAPELFEGLTDLSRQNPTSYPPLNQLLFAMAAVPVENSLLGGIVILRSIIIAADFGIFYYGRKILRALDLPESRIFWYLLNPLIIIELTGNLHFEGVMLFFLVAALYYLIRNRWFRSSIFFGFSVAIKLIPLIFLPLLFRFLTWRKAIAYSLLVTAINLLFFVPFASLQSLSNFLDSIGLWFQKFEFNAGIWYLVKWIGLQWQGYNILIYAGPVLGLLVLVLVLLLTISGNNRNSGDLLKLMLFVISTYFFLATTIHPWYLATPLLVSVFTRYRFVLIWSFLVFLSYSAYTHPPPEENLLLIFLEYLIVLAAFGWELFSREEQNLTKVKKEGGQ